MPWLLVLLVPTVIASSDVVRVVALLHYITIAAAHQGSQMKNQQQGEQASKRTMQVYKVTSN